MREKIYQEQEAFTALQKGDERGLDFFFHRYYQPLTYFAQGILKNREAAEDIAEDSFVKLWDRREQVESGGAIRAYLYTTVRNACIDLLRREKRKVMYMADALVTAEKEERPVLHRIIEAETMHLIYEAMEALPPKCGQIFKMFYLEQKSLKEIAEELGIATTTVISQKKRALELLRKKLPPEAIGSIFFLFYTL